MAAGLGFKTFTTGEVLTAADTNGYLMQGILVFASAAARDAAITSPQEGQACYLKDTNEVLTYSGSAWVAVGGTPSTPGLVLIHTETFSAQSSISVNSKFSATYDNYLIRFNNMSTSANTYMNIRMRAGGSDDSSSNYKGQFLEALSTTVTTSRTTTSTSFINIGYMQTTHQNLIMFELQNPFNTKVTNALTTHSGQAQGNIEAYQTWYGLNTTTSYDGITLFPNSGNLTGSFSIYGYAK